MGAQVLGVCPSNAILLRQMICGSLSLRPRIYQQLLRLATKDYSDRLLGCATAFAFCPSLNRFGKIGGTGSKQ